MNENQLTCDDAALEAMLRPDQSLEPSEELLTHVENCARCQERISELAGPTAMWQGVTAAISESADLNKQRRFPRLNLDQSNIHWTESMAKQLLSPPRHPEMLGRLGRYEVERLIGSGGMGVVFKAFDTELNRPVAIKLLAPYLANSGPARKRFSREARAAAAVVHQHVVPIHNVETERESPFIVMQFVSGESLQSRIDRDGALELCEILRIGMQVADGLSAAHQQGIVHRDIKPSNILLEEDVDRALISDFGLARAADDASLTRTGFHPGTPQYMSPEQASGQTVDARSDLFSLGSMLYTMCTGRPPFRAENSLSVMRRISEAEPTPIQELNPNIPEWMSAVITKLMKKSVQDRLSSAAEVRELLEALLSHVQQPLSSSLPTLPWLVSSEADPKTCEPKKRWLNMKTLILGNSLLIGSVALFMFPTDPARVQQKTASPQGTPQGTPVDNGGLGQEEKARLERLIKDNPLIVVGKLQEGEPTGSANSHAFELSQVLKGKPNKIDVLFSYIAAVAPADPASNQNPTGNLPRLNAGEYLFVLEQEEVINSFAISAFGLSVTPEKTFNHFILRDGDQHASWPVDSPQAAYIRQFLMLEQNEGQNKEVLGHGYSRQGDFIYFKEQRIDQAERQDFDRFAKSTNPKLAPCADVDAASFKALSEEYTKDKNKVYYKWISNERFWVVELPLADAKSFEVISANLAKDAKNVWSYGDPLPGVDPKTVELVNPGFVWKDAKSVWYQREKIAAADAKTFRHLDQAFYQDVNRVYWSMTPLDGADLDTFRTFGDDSPYAADRRSVWNGNTRITGYDAATFQAIHQSVNKDKNGVYAGEHRIEHADPNSFLKVADLDTSLSALLADERQYYVFLPYYGDVYQVTSTANSLNVKRSIWPPGIKQKDPVAIATAELTETAGWQMLNIVADPAINTAQLEDQEMHLLNIYTAQFTKAWEIIRERKIENNSVAQTTREEPSGQVNQPEKAIPLSEGWRSDIVAFDNYLGELAGQSRVPDEPSLVKRVTIVPGGQGMNSEVVPVTNGAGGYVDMAPAEDTVQFQVNKALKGEKVKWEFELAHDVAKSFNGVVRLMARSVIKANAKPFLGALIIDTKDELEFKAGDLVKLEATIGDASQNKGLRGLLKPTGPVAVYHLDSAPHTTFWLGITNVKISGPTRKTTARIQPAPDVTVFAKELLRASMLYDEKKLDELYAPEVQLLPGNRLFHFGLEVPGKMTEYGVPFKRAELLVALKKQAAVDPIPSLFIGQFISMYRIEQLDVSVGDYAAEPNQSKESLYRSMTFKIKENDVLLKVSVPGAFGFVQLRKTDGQWKVIAEY